MPTAPLDTIEHHYRAVERRHQALTEKLERALQAPNPQPDTPQHRVDAMSVLQAISRTSSAIDDYLSTLCPIDQDDPQQHLHLIYLYALQAHIHAVAALATLTMHGKILYRGKPRPDFLHQHQRSAEAHLVVYAFQHHPHLHHAPAPRSDTRPRRPHPLPAYVTSTARP